MDGPTVFAFPQRPQAPPELEPETATLMLRNAHAKLGERHLFHNGQLVRFKVGVCSGMYAPRGGVMMFERYERPGWLLQRTPANSFVGSHELDCIVGKLDDEGAMLEMRCCSRYLEPVDARGPRNWADIVNAMSPTAVAASCTAMLIALAIIAGLVTAL